MSHPTTFTGRGRRYRIGTGLANVLLVCLATVADPDPARAQTVSPGERPAGCGATPQRYRQREYGPTLHALEVSCRRDFSPEEQVFIAGLSQGLLQRCGFPANPQSRAKLQTFLVASGWVAAYGGDYTAPRLGDALGSQAASMTAYAAGDAAQKAVGCTAAGRLLAEGVVAYLSRTSSRYVDGCARYYEGRYTRQQCQCIADVGRAVLPEINTQEFSPESIRYIGSRNPFLSLQIGLQCRIGNY
jgi:hypothetical protein